MPYRRHKLRKEYNTRHIENCNGERLSCSRNSKRSDNPRVKSIPYRNRRVRFRHIFCTARHGMRKHIQVYLKIKFVYCVQNMSRSRPRITLNMSNKLQMRSRKDLETERILLHSFTENIELLRTGLPTEGDTVFQ